LATLHAINDALVADLAVAAFLAAAAIGTLTSHVARSAIVALAVGALRLCRRGSNEERCGHGKSLRKKAMMSHPPLPPCSPGPCRDAASPSRQQTAAGKTITCLPCAVAAFSEAAGGVEPGGQRAPAGIFAGRVGEVPARLAAVSADASPAGKVAPCRQRPAAP